MDRHFKPERLELIPNSNSAPRLWRHWYTTFQNFTLATKAEEDDDKLKLLINHVSPEIYELLDNCKTYKGVVEILTNLYIKPINEVFARYELTSRNQHSDESIDEYLEALKVLGNKCNYKAVTAEINRDDIYKRFHY